MSVANRKQVGGAHYKQFGAIQPWDVIEHFKLGFLDGNAVKYLLRWRHKGGIQDLEKAKHYIEKLIEKTGSSMPRSRRSSSSGSNRTATRRKRTTSA